MYLPEGWTFLERVAGDASGRRFSRLRRNGETAIWMECGNAHAAGHGLDDFVRLREWIAPLGISVPEIYVLDAQRQSALLEDFGALSFHTAIKSGHCAQTLYTSAAEVIERWQMAKALPALPDFNTSAVAKGHVRVMDWYVPAVTGAAVSALARSDFLDVWDNLSLELQGQSPPCFVHVDFHADNLMWLPARQGIARCGVLDFQGAMAGPPAYDWANLFEDARFDAPRVNRLVEKMHDEDFSGAYDYWALQFHCRVIGQFIKLALVAGKTEYLAHIPRLERYIKARLRKPRFERVLSFFEGLDVRFDTDGCYDYMAAGKFISEDAF